MPPHLKIEIKNAPPRMDIPLWQPPKFPPFTYQEFPKLVTAPNGMRVKVKDAAEEAQIMGVSVPLQEAAESSSNVFSERAELVAQAEAAGVKIDKRWGLARIREAIEAQPK